MCKKDEKTERRNVIFFESIDSTQRKACELARSGAESGTTVWADEQRVGRGRRDRSWSSVHGLGLYFSTVLRPDVVPGAAQLITFAASLAVVRAIDGISGLHRAEIKWPNDVTIAGRKVCGIICECASEPGKLIYAVVGIGINVLHTEADLPATDDDRPAATSLRLAFGGNVDRAELMDLTLDELDPLINLLETKRVPELLDQYGCRSATIGSRVRVMTDESDYFGTAEGLTGDGSLVVDVDGSDCGRMTFSAADVLHLR